MKNQVVAQSAVALRVRPEGRSQGGGSAVTKLLEPCSPACCESNRVAPVGGVGPVVSGGGEHSLNQKLFEPKSCRYMKKCMHASNTRRFEREICRVSCYAEKDKRRRVLRRRVSRRIAGSMSSLRVVLSRCSENGVATPYSLRAANIPVTVVQKDCSAFRGNKTLVALDTMARASSNGQVEVLFMDHNRGDECSAYLHYIVHAYESLPDIVIFLQYASEPQLMLSSVARTALAARKAMTSRGLGFMSVGRHSFEGQWPAPCEAPGKQATFRRCSNRIWRDDYAVTPPNAFRFYANGLFAVARERVLSRPKTWYAEVLARLSGRAQARCDGPDTRRQSGAPTRLVGDCHVLEKSWHVLFGEAHTMPTPTLYNALRAPSNVTLRVGGRFHEETPGGKCSASRMPHALEGLI